MSLRAIGPDTHCTGVLPRTAGTQTHPAPPFGRWRTRTSVGSDFVMSGPLRFSVIIPLEFHRGQALRCVRGWAEGQLFPREQFEIVIATPDGHPTGELEEIRGLLGPQDRVLEFDRHHDMDLCAKAAESASGEVLFFTESHCLPEPETLARADAVTLRAP